MFLGGALALIPVAHAQGEVEPAVKEFLPSDVYMQAWMTVRDGELAQQSGDSLQAYTHYQKALRLYDSVALYYPKWKPQLVKDRIDLTKRSMAKMWALAT